jgi:hypothetical protein
MTTWVNQAYCIVAVSGAFLSIYVMQKTETDRINMVDAPWLQWLRRAAFVAVSVALCSSVISDGWEPSLVVLMLVSAGVFNLLVNALALFFRSPPKGMVGEGAKVRIR